MIKIVIVLIFTLAMIRVGWQLITLPEKFWNNILKNSVRPADQAEDKLLRKMASSRAALQALRAGGVMMIGGALFILFDSIF